MHKLGIVGLGLSMIAVGLWLILASSAVHAKSDTGYLGMGEWRTTISEPDDAC